MAARSAGPTPSPLMPDSAEPDALVAEGLAVDARLSKGA